MCWLWGRGRKERKGERGGVLLLVPWGLEVVGFRGLVDGLMAFCWGSMRKSFFVGFVCRCWNELNEMNCLIDLLCGMVIYHLPSETFLASSCKPPHASPSIACLNEGRLKGRRGMRLESCTSKLSAGVSRNPTRHSVSCYGREVVESRRGVAVQDWANSCLRGLALRLSLRYAACTQATLG